MSLLGFINVPVVKVSSGRQKVKKLKKRNQSTGEDLTLVWGWYILRK